MGDNGAGKSTLVKVIAGNFPQPMARSASAARRCTFISPSKRARRASRSCTRTWRSANNLSAAANVFLGREIKRGAGPFRWLDHKAMAKRGRRVVQRAQIRDEAARSRAPDVGGATPGGRDRAHAAVEGAPRLDDEPTAAISVRQVAEVLDLIRRLKDSGMAIILITIACPTCSPSATGSS